jgi:hypothetical protein
LLVLIIAYRLYLASGSDTTERKEHEQIANDTFAAYELSESNDFENRQKARNILRYQSRGYCFELPPKCGRWGYRCVFCVHFRCRENTQYDGVKWDYDFDPDIDRFGSLEHQLHHLADTTKTAAVLPPVHNFSESGKTVCVDQNLPLNSLLTSLAEAAKTACI